jgi:hypothetical protein
MAEIRVSPGDAQSVLDRVGPGDTVVLTGGSYGAKLRLAGRAGRADLPIVLRGEPGAVLDGGRSAEDFREQGNHMALATWRGEAPGTKPHDYPGLWPWLLDGQLVLERCRHVRLENFAIERAWPTLIALDRCHDIVITNCQFRDGTFAVGAEGRDTYAITLEGCHWVQDRAPHRMWQQIPWARIHGHPDNNEPVDLEQDWRLFDGDFFRAEGIRGGVTIRNCTVTAAFNAIHLFNDQADTALSHDVRVHDCVFREIRDNVLEPEKAAFNWWFYRNEMVNCHKWFSIECGRSGYFYLFANRGWFDSIQGPAGDPHRGGGVFKLGKHVLPARGRHYVLHNSFSVRSDHIRKGVLPRFEHLGNAIRFARSGDPVYDGPAEVFGNLSADPGEFDQRFTTHWREFDILARNDVVWHDDWPDRVRQASYDVGPTLGSDPMFGDPYAGELRIEPRSPCRGRGGAAHLELPDGSTWALPKGADVGAWQGDRLFEGPAFRPLAVPVG